MSKQLFSKELAFWTSESGNDYTDRNPATAEEMERELENYYHIKKSNLFAQFLSQDKLATGRVLEVGCNIGLQLELLHKVNPALELYGVEPQAYAISKGRKRNSNIHFLPANAFDLPFKDNYFDVVMTNGVLIHINPKDLTLALAEIYRTSRRFIFFHEYFAKTPCAITYRGKAGLLWKMNYLEQYLSQFRNLKCVQESYLEYPDPDGGPNLVDQICLLEK